jgi:hypothetical protein
MGVPSTRFLGPKGTVLARKEYAVDLAHLKVDSLSLKCRPTRSARFSDMKVDVGTDYPGLAWSGNSCWLDSSMHVLSVVFAHDPSAWISSSEHTWLYRMREYLQQYWETISSYQCGGFDFDDAVRHLQENRETLRREMAAPPSAITFEKGALGTPFVSVCLMYFALELRLFWGGLAIESTHSRGTRKLGV